MERLLFLVVVTMLIFSSAALTFVHPGALDSKAGLEFVKAKIEAGEQPWTSWFNKARSSSWATRTTTGATTFDAHGGEAQSAGEDSGAAYIQALLWIYSGNETYAKSSIAILNAWSGLKSITASDDQNRLQAGWMGAELGPAAELMRSYSGWKSTEITAFQAMFRRAFYPLLNTMSTWNGNVDLTQIDAMMSIAVFNEDENEFNLGLKRLKKRMPSYFYLKSDGPTPPPIDGDGGNPQQFWSNPTKWVDGLNQETCRDNGHHAQFALGSALHSVEVAWNQGVDVYTVYQERFTAALELLALQLTSGSMQGTCSNESPTSDRYDTFEIGYSHYHYISGVALPNSFKYIVGQVRPLDGWRTCSWNLCYESLSHANLDIGNTTAIL